MEDAEVAAGGAPKGLFVAASLTCAERPKGFPVDTAALGALEGAASKGLERPLLGVVLPTSMRPAAPAGVATPRPVGTDSAGPWARIPPAPLGAE